MRWPISTWVARHGGFGRAARAAGRPKATLSRRVSELESSLDLRLFERGTRALKLTQEGRALYERTGALLAELDETAAAIASGGSKPRGRLRISAPLLFSQTAMGKLAGAFTLKYPEVRLEVTTEDRAVDMVEEGYDLVIRVNPDHDESLVGRILSARSSRRRRKPGPYTAGRRSNCPRCIPRSGRPGYGLGFRFANRQNTYRGRSRSSSFVGHHGPGRGPIGRRRRSTPDFTCQPRPDGGKAGTMGRC